MQEIPKDVLIKAAAADIQAFEYIYKVACGFVYSTALRVTNNKSDAEEITQDVFIKVYKNLKNFQFRSSFKTWVYRITVNTAINACKKIPPEIRQRADYELTLKIQHSDQQTIRTNDAEREELLAQILGVLNPDQRTCIVLKAIEGLSYKEISKVLKININTVRSRLKRAREALLAYRKSEVVKNEL